MILYVLFIFGLFFSEINFIFTNYIFKFLKNNNYLMDKYSYLCFIINIYNLNSFSSWLKKLLFLNFIINLFIYLYSFILLDFNFLDYNLMCEADENNNLPSDNSKASSSPHPTDGAESETSNTQNINVQNPNLNLNTPNLNVSVPGVFPAIIGGAAIKAGMEISKNVPSVGGKILVSAATAGLIAGAVSFGNKVGSNIADSVNNVANSVKKFLPDLHLDLKSLTGNVNGLDTYPLNLLTDMSVINSSAILFLILIVNVYIAIYLKDKDILNFIPKWLDPNKNILGKIIIFIYNRYINIWYDSRKFILIFSFIMLFICLVIVQLGLVIILNSG